MEIKTTIDIINEDEILSIDFYSRSYKDKQKCWDFRNKKWVGVDDVLKIFEDDSITSFEDLKDYIQSELIELK